MDDCCHTDLLAIGGGPANLSLAALADPIGDLSVNVLESRDSVSWHPGSLFPSSRLQVSWVKDLVSPVDPRSRFSFLNFLHENGRLYRHLIANLEYVSRRDFDQYFSWAGDLLGVRTGESVLSVEHKKDAFVIVTNNREWRARHIVLGVGQVPIIPRCADGVASPNLWHSSDHASHRAATADKSVLLVGGGQSAAEVAVDLLSVEGSLPRSLVWIAGTNGFAPLDDSPFSNEWFNPRFVEYFREKTSVERSVLLERQRASCEGISLEVLRNLYKRLYDLDYLTAGSFEHELMAGAKLSGLSKVGDRFHAALRDTVSGREREISADAVILATGFAPSLPEFLAPLIDRIPVSEGRFVVEKDYRVLWDGPDHNRIYVQNAARHSHGVADSQLSLTAWRSSVIINSLLGREHYPATQEDISLSLDRAFPISDEPENRR